MKFFASRARRAAFSWMVFAALAQAQDGNRIETALRELKQGKDVKQNVALLRAAVEQAPDPGAFARDVGTILMNEQLWPQAQSFLEIARERMPDDGIVAHSLGKTHVMQYHYNEAYVHLTAAEKLLPPGPHPYVSEYLSMVLIGLQRLDESEARAKRAIDEAAQWNAAAASSGAPKLDTIDFALNLANVYQKWMRFDDALKVLDALPEAQFEKKELARAWRVRAEILDAKGDDAGAIAAFTKNRELAPDDATGAFEFALFHVRRNRPAEARPLLEKAVALDHDHEGAHFNLARVLLRLGEKEAGQKMMARYDEIHAARIATEVELAELRHRLYDKLKH